VGGYGCIRHKARQSRPQGRELVKCESSFVHIVRYYTLDSTVHLVYSNIPNAINAMPPHLYVLQSSSRAKAFVCHRIRNPARVDLYCPLSRIFERLSSLLHRNLSIPVIPPSHLSLALLMLRVQRADNIHMSLSLLAALPPNRLCCVSIYPFSLNTATRRILTPFPLPSLSQPPQRKPKETKPNVPYTPHKASSPKP
jgi:hypothetical protein